MSDPITKLHYAAGNYDGGVFFGGSLGFNLGDVQSTAALDILPSGVKGLVWLNASNGADAAFQANVSQYIGKSNVFGFYLVDEPDPTGQYHPLVTASNLKAESDWIHAHVPGTKTFIVLMNMGSDVSPTYMNTYNPANTGIDLYGIDPYPYQTKFSGGVDLSIIPKAVDAAVVSGVPKAQQVPVYQAFGNGTGTYANFNMPTAAQEQNILTTFGASLPAPVFDFVYAWGQQGGDKSLSSSPELQTVFAAHNSLTGAETPPPLPPIVTVDTLVLQLSEDAWRGDAKFIVKVDGTKIGGFSVTASHRLGQTQDFTFQHDWTDGVHAVEIDFINDAYRGSHDRNLWINQVSYDGVAYGPTNPVPLYSNGAFTIDVGHPS